MFTSLTRIDLCQEDVICPNLSIPSKINDELMAFHKAKPNVKYASVQLFGIQRYRSHRVHVLQKKWLGLWLKPSSNLRRRVQLACRKIHNSRNWMKFKKPQRENFSKRG
jgi:hypothetical protein